MIDFQAKARHN